MGEAMDENMVLKKYRGFLSGSAAHIPTATTRRRIRQRGGGCQTIGNDCSDAGSQSPRFHFLKDDTFRGIFFRAPGGRQMPLYIGFAIELFTAKFFPVPKEPV